MAKNFLYTHIADYVMADTAKGSAAFLICTCGTLKHQITGEANH